MSDSDKKVQIELPKELDAWVDSATEMAMVNNARALREVLRDPNTAILTVTDRLAFRWLAEEAYAEGFAAGSGYERVPEPSK